MSATVGSGVVQRDRLALVTAAAAVGSGALGVRWDLTPLAPSEEAMKERLEAAVADASAFEERWPAKSLETIEPTMLWALLRELADIRAVRQEALGRAPRGRMGPKRGCVRWGGRRP